MKMFLITLILFSSFSAFSQNGFDRVQTKAIYQPGIINDQGEIKSSLHGKELAGPSVILQVPVIQKFSLDFSEIPKRMNVWLSAGIGAVIGAGIGSLIGYTTYKDDSWLNFRSYRTILFGGGGLIVGIGLGSAVALMNNQARRKYFKN